jgi:hypothetical protein
MPHYITLIFDTEDLCWPGSDEIALDLARVLNRLDAPGCFCVVGEKARLWRRRGRGDIVAALAGHDLSLHTDLHSVHPTVSEYLAPCGWHDGVHEVLHRELPGLRSHAQIFGRPASAWGQAGGTWGPQVHAAMAAAGVPCTIYPAPYTASNDVCWYGGTLNFPEGSFHFFDTALLDAAHFGRQLTAMGELIDQRIAEGQPWTGIFVCHPTMLRATIFWDKLNFAAGRNTDPAHYRMPELHPEQSYRLALQNFETLVRALQDDGRLALTTFAELRQRFPAPSAPVEPDALLVAARQFIQAGEDIPTDNSALAPAEALDLFCRALGRDEPAALPRRPVYGPVEEPPEAAAGSLAWPALLAACDELAACVAAHGYLPARIGTATGPLGPATLARAAAAALLARAAGEAPEVVALEGGRQTPAIADEIIARVRRGIAGWPVHDPALDPQRILLHTRLQCWTLRPASQADL